MTAAGVLARAHAAGLAVAAEGGNLRLRGPVKPPADLLAELRAHKAEVLALLTAPPNDPLPDAADPWGLSATDRTEALARLSVPPADAPALLHHLRDVLHCRVALEGDQVTIRPTHRCPPAVVAAALAVAGDLRALLEAEAPEPMPIPPSENQVEELAAALADRAVASGAVRFNGGREAAMPYFRGQARNLLSVSNDPMVRGLLVGFERHRAGERQHEQP